MWNIGVRYYECIGVFIGVFLEVSALNDWSVLEENENYPPIFPPINYWRGYWSGGIGRRCLTSKNQN